MGLLARHSSKTCAAYVAWLAYLACSLSACSGSELDASERDASNLDASVLVPAPEVPLCERARRDAVRDLFCASEPPSIASLRDLFAALELTPAEPLETPTIEGVAGPGPAFVLLAHSTSLSGRHVSPINPRIIVLGDDVIAAFQRGVQNVELVARDRGDNLYNFYLVSFEQACNATARGCGPGDLYTPRIEQGWSALRLEDDEMLKNTPADCRQCHQRAQAEPRLLMRELRTPWTHFFLPLTIHDELPSIDGSDLTQDYLTAKLDERYGGASLAALESSWLFALENIVSVPQPLLFDAPRIIAERYPESSDGVYAEEPLKSPSWQAGYEAFKRGEQLALPYYDARATDPVKQAGLTIAYRGYLAGHISADELPDLSDVHPDDPHERAHIGLQTEPNVSPRATLIQACGSCHNDVLDQTISRARFSIDLSRMSRAQLDLAIDRIELDRDTPGAMPPPDARQIDPNTRAALIKYLSSTQAALLDPALQHAAHQGMSGGAGQ